MYRILITYFLLVYVSTYAQSSKAGVKNKYPAPEPLSNSPLLSSNQVGVPLRIPAIDYSAPYSPSGDNDDRVVLFNEIRMKAGAGDADSLYRLASYYYPLARYPVVSLDRRNLTKEQRALPDYPSAILRDNLARLSLAYKFYINAADSKHYRSMVALMLLCEREAIRQPTRDAVVAASKWRMVIGKLWGEPKQATKLEISSASLQMAEKQAADWLREHESVPTPALSALDTASKR